MHREAQSHLPVPPPRRGAGEAGPYLPPDVPAPGSGIAQTPGLTEVHVCFIRPPVGGVLLLQPKGDPDPPQQVAPTLSDPPRSLLGF